MREKTGHAAKRAVGELTPDLWRLLTEQEPEDPWVAFEIYFDFGGPKDRLLPVWRKHGDVVLPRWQEDRPGTRPQCWWHYDAPRWDDPYPGTFFHGRMPEPRRRLGGRGDPVYEVLNHVPHFDHAVPKTFYTQADAEAHGKVLPNRHHDRPAVPYDADDPPRFESQATYLARHGLLGKAEFQAAGKLGLFEATHVVRLD